MGLLDDAIREHLELKRKHGANPEDVARQEQEALGPGQRNEFAQPQPEEEPAAPLPSETTEPEPEPAAEQAAEAPPEVRAEEPPEVAEDPPAAPVEQPTAEVPAYGADPWLEEDPDEVPADEALERPRAPRAEAEDEDVLEETPDFLQETPEHDRLWFEQKPPRNFDWDK
jgi:hypothetical protein